MGTIFWEQGGILLVDFLEPGQTVNGDRYIRDLRKLKRAIRDKRPDIDVDDITIHHDNACPHACMEGHGRKKLRSWDGQ